MYMNMRKNLMHTEYARVQYMYVRTYAYAWAYQLKAALGSIAVKFHHDQFSCNKYCKKWQCVQLHGRSWVGGLLHSETASAGHGSAAVQQLQCRQCSPVAVPSLEPLVVVL